MIKFLALYKHFNNQLNENSHYTITKELQAYEK